MQLCCVLLFALKNEFLHMMSSSVQDTKKTRTEAQNSLKFFKRLEFLQITEIYRQNIGIILQLSGCILLRFLRKFEIACLILFCAMGNFFFIFPAFYFVIFQTPTLRNKIQAPMLRKRIQATSVSVTCTKQPITTRLTQT